MKEKTGNTAAPDISAEEKAIFDWINGVTFKKKRFGGVDETDVWRKIDELNKLYEKLLIAERAKCAAEAADE